MAKVFGIGETLIDMVFLPDNHISAIPGGSVLNAMVSLGRLGVDVSLISDFGIDRAGDIIEKFLSDNQVDTANVERMADYKTSIALAFINEEKDAEYSFYKDYPDERLSHIDVDFDDDTILLFGSFFALTQSTRKSLIRLLSKANAARSTIIYDPNFREPHLNELEKLKTLILENISFADIVRGSDEDFNLIFGANCAEEAWKYVGEAGCANLIYTANSGQVAVITPSIKIWLDVPKIDTVSTIGAGDNFNAGIIWTLVREELNKRDLEHLPKSKWELMAKNGISFSADVCKRKENYISVEFAVEVLKQP